MDEAGVPCPCVVIHKALLSMAWAEKRNCHQQYDPDMCGKHQVLFLLSIISQTEFPDCLCKLSTCKFTYAVHIAFLFSAYIVCVSKPCKKYISFIVAIRVSTPYFILLAVTTNLFFH